MALLDVKGLKAHFFMRRGVVRAVDDISFSIDSGETLGLVGESGCGKSTTALALLGLIRPPGRIVGGSIEFDGVDLVSLSEREMRKYRGKHLSMILQDPLSSLNPVFSIENQVCEGISIHEGLKGPALRAKAVELLRLLGIPAAETRLKDYPHQLSGGMRQRVVGGISLACHPRLLIADEPTTSLDVTIQLQYLNLLKSIQQRERFAMMFVTHDFGIVAKMCTHVAVMYAGKIVEAGPVRDIFDHPLHPYTRALMKAVPTVDKKVERLDSIPGQPPALLNLSGGCAFVTRCAEKTPMLDRCSSEEFPPEVKQIDGHRVRCWRHV
jgi:oligopeptide/dipeptide ABC transporter ATP-binding protein